MTPLLTHFLPGVLVGWGLNYFLTLLTRREVVEEVTHAPVASGRRRRIPSWLQSRHVLAVLTVFVVVVTLSSTFLVFQRQEEQARCLRAVYDTTSRRLNDAGVFAAQDRAAVDAMVSGVLVPGKTPAERGQVLVDYLAGRKARDAERAKLPPYPLTRGCPN